jgi:uncharacterized protein (TIGR02271 family)
MNKEDMSLPPNLSSQQETVGVWAEELNITKKVADTGAGVRIQKTVAHNDHLIDLSLSHEEVTVERFPISDIIDSDVAPQVRYEGSTMVIPVLEEVVVIQKKYRLKEEIRVTRHIRQVDSQHSITLRAEEVVIERFEKPKE